MNGTGAAVCDGCPTGRSTNDETGRKTCSRCSELNTPQKEGFEPVTICEAKMQCGKPGGNLFFQDQIGSPTCRECPNSGAPGAYGCNEVNGNFQCYGLYMLATKCQDAQLVFETLLAAGLAFVVSISFIIPIIFLTGALAVLARQWRKDLSVLLQWMKNGSKKAARAEAADELMIESTLREEDLEEAFRVVCAGKASNKVSLRDIGPLVKQLTGIDERQFVRKLAKALNVDAQRALLDFRCFRRFLSVVAQRLEFARTQQRAARAYREQEERCLRDGDGARVTALHVTQAAETFGFADLTHRWQAVLESLASPRTKPEDLARVGLLGSKTRRRRRAAFNLGGAPATATSDEDGEDEEEDDDGYTFDFTAYYSIDERRHTHHRALPGAVAPNVESGTALNELPSDTLSSSAPKDNSVGNVDDDDDDDGGGGGGGGGGKCTLERVPENAPRTLLSDKDVITSADYNNGGILKFASDIPEHLKCSFTLELMVDPVLAEDGNTYERAAIVEWIAANGTSPLDPSRPLNPSRLTSNRMAKQLIQELVASGNLDDGLFAAYSERQQILPLEQVPDDSSEDDSFNGILEFNRARESFLRGLGEEPGGQEDAAMGRGGDEVDVNTSDGRTLGNETIEHLDDFTIECFLHAINTLSKLRLREEVNKLREKARNEYLAAYRIHGVHQRCADGSETFVLDARGFRAACANLNLIWSFTVLEDVLQSSLRNKFARKILRALESDAAFALVVLLIGLEVVSMRVKGSWVATCLILEFIARIICYGALGTHSPRQFFATKSNGRDALASLFDLTYLFFIFGDAPRARFVESKISELVQVGWLSDLDRVARLFRISLRLLCFAFPLLWSLEVAFRSLRQLCGARENFNQKRGKAVVPSYKVFRSYISAMFENSASVWPLSEYLTCFQHVNSYDGSTILIEDIPVLLQSLGFDSSPSVLADIEHIVRNEIEKDLVFFDDMVHALVFLRDERIETKVHSTFESRRLRAKRALKLIIARMTSAVVVFVTEFLATVVELIVNLYILTKGIIDEEDINTEATVTTLTSALDNLPVGKFQELFQSFLSAMFGVVTYAANKLTIDVAPEDGVTCAGTTSLLVLPIICMVTAIIVLVYDSSLFTFLEIAPSEYKHHVSYFVHRFVPTAYARSLEGSLFLGLFSLCSSLLKNLIQVTIASMLVSKYLPYWDERTRACEADVTDGGVPHSEVVASLTATVVFYCIAPATMHTLLNTFVWGLTPPSSSTSSLSCSVDEYVAKPADDENYFRLLGRIVTGTDVGKWFSLVPQQADSGTHSEDLVLHDPKFWQVPSVWWNYFKRESEGLPFRAFVAYFKTMLWKAKSLFLLTVGYWSEHQIEQFQVRYRSNFMSFSDETQEEHEAMLTAIGQQQSTFWLFVPLFGPFLNKLGEALNSTPLFVFDRIIPKAMERAQERYNNFCRTHYDELDEREKEARKKEGFTDIPPEGKNDSGKASDREDDSPPLTSLPPGWTLVPSRSRPGKTSYMNMNTGAVTGIHPLDPQYLRHVERKERKLRRSETGANARTEHSERHSSRNEAAGGKTVSTMTMAAAKFVDKLDTMPIKKWLGQIKKNYDRYATHFTTQNVHTVSDLRRLDDAGFLFLRTRIKDNLRDQKKQLTRILTEMAAVRDCAREKADRPPPGTVEDQGSGRRAKVVDKLDAMPVRNWLERIKKSYGRFAIEFVARDIHAVADLRGLDEVEYAKLRKRIRVNLSDHRKQSSRILREMAVVRESVGGHGNQKDTADFSSRVALADVPEEEDTDINETSESSERGIYFFAFNGARMPRNHPFREHNRCWLIEVKRPRGALLHSGEGMLVWFSNDSIIGSASSPATVKFVQYQKSEDDFKKNHHSEALSAMQSSYLFDFDHLSKAEVYGKFSGSNLPSQSEPIFIPKSSLEGYGDYFICALQMSCPTGMANNNFVVGACYCRDTPLLGLDIDMRRKMEWFTNLLMVLSTTTIVLAGESSTEIMAVYIFLLACLTQAAIAAESRYVSPFFIQCCTRKYVRCFICPSCVYCCTSSLIIWKSMVVRGYTH